MRFPSLFSLQFCCGCCKIHRVLRYLLTNYVLTCCIALKSAAKEWVIGIQQERIQLLLGAYLMKELRQLGGVWGPEYPYPDI